MNDDIRRTIRLKVVREITGLSTTTIWRKVKDGTFPQPVKLSQNSTGWFLDEVRDYQNALPRSNQKQPETTVQAAA